MFFVLTATFGFLGTGSAKAMSGSTAATLSYLTISDSNQTPYQRIKALYYSAAPMRLDQFLTPTSPDLENWSCTITVGQNTKLSDVIKNVLNWVPVAVTGKIVVGAEKKGAGPLFPAVPAQDHTVKFVIQIPSNNYYEVPNESSGSAPPTAEDLGQFYVSSRAQVRTYPGVSQLWLIDPKDQNSWVTDTYRTINNLIVIKVAPQEPKYSSDSGYGYCWEQGPNPDSD